MSLDVFYSSFSLKRADNKWEFFVNKLKEDRQPEKPLSEQELKDKELLDKLDKIKDELKQIKWDIISHFKDLDYYIPWFKWGYENGTDEDGNAKTMTKHFKYLLNGGKVYFRPEIDYFNYLKKGEKFPFRPMSKLLNRLKLLKKNALTC